MGTSLAKCCPFPPKAQWAHIRGGFCLWGKNARRWGCWGRGRTRGLRMHCSKATQWGFLRGVSKWKPLGGLLLPRRPRGKKFSLWSAAVYAPEQEGKNGQEHSDEFSLLQLTGFPGTMARPNQGWRASSHCPAPGRTVGEQWGVLAASPPAPRPFQGPPALESHVVMALALIEARLSSPCYFIIICEVFQEWGQCKKKKFNHWVLSLFSVS